MARVIAQRDLRNQNATVMAAVTAGETFVITRNGRPVAELRPLPLERRTFVPKAHLAALSTRTPHVDAATFRRDLDRALDGAL